MIDRSYLPFQSARDYQDPGMQKWMGFYLSEHTSSLSEEKNRVDFSIDLDPVEKLHLLSQLYISQLKGCFVVKEKRQKATIIGEVRELSHYFVLNKENAKDGREHSFYFRVVTEKACPRNRTYTYSGVKNSSQ